jgi:hypothetical protein
VQSYFISAIFWRKLFLSKTIFLLNSRYFSVSQDDEFILEQTKMENCIDASSAANGWRFLVCVKYYR